jgi:uncharacterized protein YodC (DUF2158 family)
MNSFKVGDIVKLKSDSPKMTINKIIDEDRVQCYWFDASTLIHAVFHPDSLELLD